MFQYSQATTESCTNYFYQYFPSVRGDSYFVEDDFSLLSLTTIAIAYSCCLYYALTKCVLTPGRTEKGNGEPWLGVARTLGDAHV